MKGIKNIWLLIFIGIVIMNFSGCSSAPPGLQDTSIPWQEHAMLLTLRYNYTDVWVNDIDGQGGSSIFGGGIIDCNSVGLIPPGTHLLGIGVKGYRDGGEYTNYGAHKMTYEFQPGGRYVLIGEIQVIMRRGIGKMEIYTVEEFRDVYKGNSFQSSVLDRFEETVSTLSKE